MKGALTPLTQAQKSLADPNYPLFSLQRAVNRIFHDFFNNVESYPSIFSEELSAFSPKVDVSESEKQYTVSAELPGLDQNDIEVSIGRDMLAIKGEKKQEKEEKDKGHYRMERSYGAFYRTIPLPCEIDTEAAEAKFKNGVLAVTLPKSKTALPQSKKLTVKAG